MNHLVSLPKETYYQTFKALCKPENVNDDVTIAFSEEQLIAAMKDHQSSFF